MPPNILLGTINIASALLIMGVSIPLIRQKIKMNHWYGIRIAKSFESQENWYKINAYGGKQMMIWTAPMIVVGMLCFVVPINDANKDAMALALGAAPIFLCLTVAVVRIYAYARKL